MLLSALAISLWVGLQVSHDTREHYCRPGQGDEVSDYGRYCYRLFDELDPWAPRNTQVFDGPAMPGTRGGSNLFPGASLQPETIASVDFTGRLAIKYRSLTDPTDEWVAWCTGALLPDNYVLTANHCLPGALADSYFVAEARFLLGYVNAQAASEVMLFPVVADEGSCSYLGHPPQAICPAEADHSPATQLDFSVLQIGPAIPYGAASGGETADEYFDPAVFDLIPPNAGAGIRIPQHPWSYPLQIGMGVSDHPRAVVDNGRKLVYAVSTFNMSSGAPVLSLDTNALVAVHTRELTTGCLARADLTASIVSGCRNSGSTISAIMDQSPTVQCLVRNQLVGQVVERLRTSAPLLFPYDSSQLNTREQNRLQRITSMLLEAGSPLVSLHGHTDNARGPNGNLITRQYALTLSERFADVVRAAMIEYGYPPDQIQLVAWGIENPVVESPPGEQEPMNRRVEIEFEMGRPSTC